MVEGPECHRVAAAHRKQLMGGGKFDASSPNGRFSEGASAIVKAGGNLERIEVHGKNMFYFFGGGGEEQVVVRVHFGMAGEFAAYVGKAPAPKPATRLRLTRPGVTAHLSAMTVEHGTVESLYDKCVAGLGTDPLREDADFGAFVNACDSSKGLGGLLMDQSKVAGIGNIYRSEILYEAGIHPEQAANTLTLEELEALWDVITQQMEAGFETGSIWDPAKGPQVYGLSKSACGGKVTSWQIGGRAVYACSKKQPLLKRDPQHREAPVGLLTKKKAARKLAVSAMISALDAAEAKVAAGESANVQHVALKDDGTLELAQKKSKQTAVKKVSVKKVSVKKTIKKVTDRKPASKTKKAAPVKKTTAKNLTSKKSTAKKVTVKKPPVKKAVVKKTIKKAAKETAKKTAAKKVIKK